MGALRPLFETIRDRQRQQEHQQETDRLRRETEALRADTEARRRRAARADAPDAGTEVLGEQVPERELVAPRPARPPDRNAPCRRREGATEDPVDGHRDRSARIHLPASALAILRSLGRRPPVRSMVEDPPAHDPSHRPVEGKVGSSLGAAGCSGESRTMRIAARHPMPIASSAKASSHAARSSRAATPTGDCARTPTERSEVEAAKRVEAPPESIEVRMR